MMRQSEGRSFPLARRKSSNAKCLPLNAKLLCKLPRTRPEKSSDPVRVGRNRRNRDNRSPFAGADDRRTIGCEDRCMYQATLTLERAQEFVDSALFTPAATRSHVAAHSGPETGCESLTFGLSNQLRRR